MGARNSKKKQKKQEQLEFQNDQDNIKRLCETILCSDFMENDKEEFQKFKHKHGLYSLSSILNQTREYPYQKDHVLMTYIQRVLTKETRALDKYKYIKFLIEECGAEPNVAAVKVKKPIDSSPYSAWGDGFMKPKLIYISTLSLAVLHSTKKIIKYLLTHRTMDYCHEDALEKSSYTLAVTTGMTDILDLFIDVNERNTESVYPLWKSPFVTPQTAYIYTLDAVATSNTVNIKAMKSLRHLFEKYYQSDANARVDHMGNTAVHRLCECIRPSLSEEHTEFHIMLFSMFLDNGYVIDTINHHGMTGLMIICNRSRAYRQWRADREWHTARPSDHVDIIQLLCEYGASLTLENFNGQTAFDMILNTSDVNLIKMITERHMQSQKTKRTSETKKERDINNHGESSSSNSSSSSSSSSSSTTDIEIKDENICAICMEGERDCLILPCKHRCICQNCCDGVRQRKECPMCRKAISGIIEGIYN